MVAPQLLINECRQDGSAPFGVVLEVLNSIPNTSDPIPSLGFDIAKPRTAEFRIGDYDRATTIGQDVLQPPQNLTMSSGVVVAAHRMDLFADQNRSPLHRNRRFEHALLVRHLAADTNSFPMQVSIAQQLLNSLDVMLGEGSTRAAMPQMGQRELTPVKQHHADPYLGMELHTMVDDGVASQQSVRQVHCVHADLSGFNYSVEFLSIGSIQTLP